MAFEVRLGISSHKRSRHPHHINKHETRDKNTDILPATVQKYIFYATMKHLNTVSLLFYQY